MLFAAPEHDRLVGLPHIGMPFWTPFVTFGEVSGSCFMHVSRGLFEETRPTVTMVAMHLIPAPSPKP